MARFKRLIALLQEGDSPQAALRALLPSEEASLLERCAAVRTFDEALVEKVLRPGIERPEDRSFPFEALTRHPSVEASARRPNEYRVKESVRQDYVEQWLKAGADAKPGQPPVPEWLRALAGSLVKHFTHDGANFELELLYQLLIADPPRAADWFRDRCTVYDKQFDLARCFDLVGILEEREKLLVEDLQNVLKQQQVYLKARMQWSNEYYKTIPYFERAELHRQFAELLNDSRRWIFQVYARGAAGKTMFVRWVLSRWCVPARVPCARIDFDFKLDPITASRDPWLLLLYLAEQLNSQISGNVFHELLKDLDDYRNASNSGQSQTLGTAHLEASVPNRFATTLANALKKQKVVLVFDTFEDVILHQPKQFFKLLQEMERLNAKYPPLQLVLAGRHNLRERVDDQERVEGFTSTFGSKTLTFPLSPFTDTEAREYLTEKRGLAEDGRLKTVIARAQGNPFTLALYADLLQAEPGLDDARLREVPAEQIYLINRIIDRIKDPQLLWTLRYGVVPRQLTEAFLRDVLAEPLWESMTKGTPDDDPAKDQLPLENRPAPFRSGILKTEDQVPVEHLWRSLGNYASESSWVSPEGGSRDALIFQPEVVNPLRRLLQKDQPAMFERLHQAALRYYEKKADVEQRERGRWIREAIYHRCQLGDPQGKYWQEQLDRQPETRDPQWRREIALELTRAEYVGLVNDATFVKAYFELARANIRHTSRVPGEEQRALWVEARARVDAAEKLERDLGQKIIAEGPRAQVRAAILVHEGRIDEALNSLESALARIPEGAERARLAEQLAGVLDMLGRYREAISWYEEAQKQRVDESEDTPYGLRLKLARQYEKVQLFDRAAEHFEAALKRLPQRSPEYPRCRRFLSETTLQMGQFAAAENWVPEDSRRFFKVSGPEADIEKMRWRLARVKLLLTKRDGAAALALVEETSKQIDALAASIPPFERAARAEAEPLRAEVRELSGEVLAAHMDFGPALQALEEAQVIYVQIGQPDRARRSFLRRLERLLDEVGDLRGAAAALGRGADFLSGPDREVAIRARLCQARLRRRQRRRIGTPESIDREVKETDPPRLKIQVALAIQALRDPDSSAQNFATLLAGLRDVSPASARQLLVDSLRYCPEFTDVSDTEREQLVALFPPLPGGEAWPALRLLRAEVCRVAGRTELASSLLARAEWEFLEDANCFALREVLEARDRLGWPATRRPVDVSKEILDLAARSKQRALVGVMLLQQAARLYSDQAPDQAHEILKNALPALESLKFPSRWLAQAYTLQASIEKDQGRAEAHRTATDQARQILEGLDDLLALQDLERASDDRSARNLESTLGYSSPLSDTCLIQLAADATGVNRTVSVNLIVPEGPPGRKTLRVQDVPLLRDCLTVPSGALFSETFCELFTNDWKSAAAAMTDWVFGPNFENLKEFFPSSSASGGKLRLEIDESLLAPLPWEFMTRPNLPVEALETSSLIRPLYRAIPQPSTRSVQPKPRPFVLILQPSERTAKVIQRGSGGNEPELGDLYKRHGFDVVTLQDPDWTAVFELTSKRQPDLVHACATLRHSTSQGVLMEIGDQQRSNGTVGFSASMLKQALTTAFDAVIILDIARPPGLGEAVRQLFQRNVLARDLIQVGAGVAVIGTGLGTPREQLSMWRTLTEGLGKGCPLGKTCQEIRQMALLETMDLDELLVSVGTALFTQDPNARVVQTFSDHARWWTYRG